MKLNLETLSMQVLVNMYNTIADKPVTIKTFSQRSKAIERINKVAEEKGLILDDLFKPVAPPVPSPEALPVPSLEALPVPSLEALPVPSPEALPVPSLEVREEAPSEPPALPASPNSETSEKVLAKPVKAKKEKAPKADKGPSIRSVAEALILEVVSRDEDNRPIGLSYEEILNRIHDRFPAAKTSVACLRWYAVHMRDRGVMPPGRPRALAHSINDPETGKATHTEKKST